MIQTLIFQALYNYFKERLDEKIRSYGESRMTRDVARLRVLNQGLYDQCVLEDTSSSKDVKLDQDMRPYNGDTIGYSIRYCVHYTVFRINVPQWDQPKIDHESEMTTLRPYSKIQFR